MSGLAQGRIQDVTLTLHGLTHTYPQDLSVLLAGPQQQVSVVVMAHVGGDINVDNIDVTFDDAASAVLTDVTPLQAGTYQPSIGGVIDLSGPAPLVGYQRSLAAFDGSDPNGVWTLWVFDHREPDGGALAGWSLTITAEVAAS